MNNALHPPFTPAYESTLYNSVQLLLSTFYKSPSLFLIKETLNLCYDIIVYEQQVSERRFHLHEEDIKSKQVKETPKEVYYDEDDDQAIVKKYYKDLNPSDLAPDEMVTKLTELLTITHINQLSYSNSRKALHSWIDLRADGSIKSIYSGQNLDATDLMAQDHAMENQAIQQMEQVLSQETNVLNEHKDILIESILRTLRFNVEHVIPQSWFKKRHPMVADLHHLFTCEQDCNSFRSNIPYYDFADYEPSIYKEIIKNSCGKRDGIEKFEPENGKGEISRAILYFLLRYPTEILQDKQLLLDINLYKKWHHEHPVTLHEKHRNWAIYKLQGNRNPYIDFPKLANLKVGIQ